MVLEMIVTAVLDINKVRSRMVFILSRQAHPITPTKDTCRLVILVLLRHFIQYYHVMDHTENNHHNNNLVYEELILRNMESHTMQVMVE